MRKKLFVLLVLLLVSNDIAYGKDGNKTKSEPVPSKKSKTTKYKGVERFKRASGDRGLFRLPNDDDITSHNNLKLLDSIIKADDVEEEPPFWGARGRRDSSSIENLSDLQYILGNKFCHNCKGFCIPYSPSDGNDVPFWGNCGRRSSSSESDKNDLDSWDERVRRQDDQDDPFWGSRGRRNEDPPFWGSRGRREQSLRGKSNKMSPGKVSRWYDNEDEPFWGSRGRRKMGKVRNSRQNEEEPFWGSRGKKGKYKLQYTDEEREPFWGNRGRRKLGFNFNPNQLDIDVDSMSKIKRKEITTSFWANRGRESTLKNLFTGSVRSQVKYEPTTNDINKEVSKGFHVKPSEQNTVHDDRIYAEEPYFILIERSSRSSVEDDPYIITRGKKYSNYHLPKAVRDRRGAIEDIVKSVQNDPYYIARGKKDSFVKIGNTLMSVESLIKDKDAICALVNSLLSKTKGDKVKREVNDSERDRRTILKKLAAQLQEDPYFVSRGKKDLNSDNELKEFVQRIIDTCY